MRYLLLFFFIFLYTTIAFPNGLCRTAIVTSTPIPAGPTCVNGGQLITITCFNSSVSYVACNGTGSGGNTTVYASNVIYYPSIPSNFNNLTNTTVDVALNLLGSKQVSIVGGNNIAVTNLNATTFLVSFNGALSSSGIGFSLVANGPNLALKGLEAGPGVFISQLGNDLSIESDIGFVSSSVGGATLIDNSSPSSLTLNEIVSNVPLLSFLSSGGAITVSWSIICPDGRPSILINNVSYCAWSFTSTPNSPTCNGGTTYQLLVDTNIVAATFCQAGALSFVISSVGGGVPIISSSTNTSTNLRSFTDTTSLAWSSTLTTLSADVSITATDVTSGFASVLAGCTGANCNFRQFRGADPSLINVQQDSTTVYVTSNLKAQNLPYPNVSVILFPDCPTATTQGDINECLATRTIPSLSNFTNAAQILYTPSQPVLGQVNITAAVAFNTIFINSKPSFTRIWNVDANNGNDVTGDGSPLSPYKTVAKAFSMIGTFLWNQAQLVNVAFGAYLEGPLEWPPNTFLDTNSNTRGVMIIAYNVTLRADWAVAGPHVEGGIADATLFATTMNIDFTMLGVRPPTSIARFSVYNALLDVASITVNGGGVTDLFHVVTSDVDGGLVSVNCANIHIENSIIESSLSLTDTACSATLLNWHLVFNYMEDGVNTTIAQSTSTVIQADFFLNGWDGGFLAVYGATPGALTLNTFTLPINYYIDATVTINRNLALESAIAAGLDPVYWGSVSRNALQMMLTLASRAKTLSSTGSGTSLISSTTTTTNFLNSLTSLTSALTISSSLGNIYFDIITANLLFGLTNPFRGQSSISFAYLAGVEFDEVLPSVTNVWWVDPVNGDDTLGTGAPNNKFKTIEFTFSVIGTFPATQTQQVMLMPGIYAENSILWPPNTYVVGFGSREDRVTVSSPNNVELRSDWSTFANDLVEAGLENVDWTCSKFLLEFANVMGGAGPSSDANFNFYNAYIDAVYIITGRGETDHISWRETVVLLNIDPDCVSIYSRDSDFNGNFAITDNNCAGTNLVIDLLYNKFGATFSATRSAATTFAVASMLNTYTLGAGTSFNGALTLTANGLPPDVVIDPSATLTNILGAISVVMDGLPTPYYSSTTLAVTDIINTITPRAKSLVHSGVGATPIFSTTTTTDTLNGFSGTTNQFTVTPGGGTLTGSVPTDFRPPGIIYLSTATGISAAGATQGTATALSATVLEHVVSTVAAGTGVRLPTPATGGAKYTVYNRGLNALNVYPAVGGTIDAAAINMPVVIPAGATAQYTSVSTTQWFTSETVAVGGGGISATYGLGQTTLTALGVPSSTVPASFSNTATLTITNPGAAVFTSIAPAGTGSLTFAANTLVAGSKICVSVKGVYASATATTLTYRWRLDGITVYGPSSSVTTGAVANVRLNVDTCLLILTAGAGGTALPVGEMEAGITQPLVIPNAVLATALDTTVAHTVDVQLAYSTLNAANTNRISSFYVTHIRT